MKVNDQIHDYVSLFGMSAWVLHGLDVRCDWGYYNHLCKMLGVSSKYPFENGVALVDSICTVDVDIVHGVYTVQCHNCTGRVIVRKFGSLWLCTRCMVNGAVFGQYTLRSDAADVETVLLERPHIKNRNAFTHETYESLVLENKENL